MRIGDVTVTEHAWERWQQRYPGAAGLRNPDDDTLKQHLKTIFKRAKVEEMDPVSKVKRLIDNGGEEAHYLFDKGTKMRFVLNADQTAIVTIEEDKFWTANESRPSKKKFR